MDYIVQHGDSLWSIAGKKLGDPHRWREIARLNSLESPYLLLIGQRLIMPRHAPAVGSHLQTTGPIGTISREHSSKVNHSSVHSPATRIPARAFFFIVADEINPFTKKVVRKVVFPKGLEDARLIERIVHPERYGFAPRNPGSKVPIGRHVLGMTDSKYISASELPLGSPRFEGKRYWIDVDQLRSSGAAIHDGAAIGPDLDRIAAKTKDPTFRGYIEDIRRKSTVIDREVLIEGHIPAAAVKGAGAMAVTRGLQVIEGVGIVISVYDLGQAGMQSYHEHSVVPIARESVRQVGGWGGAMAGAELGGSVGGLLGIETGPGAIITGAVGGFIGGVAGFLGADWVARRIGAESH